MPMSIMDIWNNREGEGPEAVMLIVRVEEGRDEVWEFQGLGCCRMA